MLKILLVLTLALPLKVFAQITITGRVLNQTDIKPIQNVNVFLSNATIGDKTNAVGAFTLSNVKPGKYDLVVSMVGYETYKLTIIAGDQNITIPDITIYPKTIGLGEVTIKAERNNIERGKYLELFTNEFLGSTELAKQCKILNPELLYLHYDATKSILTASSNNFLEVENRALGYKVKYLLSSFTLDNSNFETKILNYTGSVLFEKLNGTPSQEKNWEKQRSLAYEDSQMHFLRSAIANNLTQQGFRVLRLPLKPVNATDSIIYVDKQTYENSKILESLLIRGPDQQGLYTLNNNNDRLYISYNKYHHFVNSSYTRLSDPDNTLIDFTTTTALFDNNGMLTDPHSFTVDGAWARTGVAGLLPVDYDDGQPANIKPVNAQISNIINRLKTYSDSAKREKAYLQFDKPYHVAGDTIYFKAYVTQGAKHEPSKLSSVLYVDLMTNSHFNKSIKLKLQDGVGWGDFSLPDTLKDGECTIRAYTNLMRNNIDEIFNQNIIIGTISNKKIAKVGESNHANSLLPIRSNKVDVQFLPEGGSLITGNYSKIAFKAITPNGLGTDIKGTITDDTGNKVCIFSSSHLGMGSFNMVAEAGKTYKANITYADSTKSILELPRAISAGYTININNTNADTIRLRVTAGDHSDMNKLCLIAQSGGIVYYAAEITGQNKFFSAIIPKSKFPSGIAQFTLFSAIGEPLIERLIFIQNPDQLKFNLSAKKQNYSPREKVVINLDARDKDDKIVNGSFSAVVTDETKIPGDEANESNIITTILLTSDLKGVVEQPNYYFTNSSEKITADLDLLMLTQGYRHFEWKQMLNNNFPSNIYRPEKGITISGKVMKHGEPVAGSEVTLFSDGATGFLRDTLTDAKGRFIFGNLFFPDSTKFVFQAKVAKGQDNITLQIDSDSSIRTTTNYSQININKEDIAISTYLKNQKQFYQEQLKYGINKHAVMLNEVVIKNKKSFLTHSDNLNGPGSADVVITGDDLKKLTGNTLSFRIRDKVFGLVHFVQGVPWSNHPLDQAPAPMLIVIDGNYVEYDEYDKLNPDRVQSIEVLTSPNFATVYGPKGGHGILVITTKKGKDYTDSNERYAPGVITYMPKGFYKAREFYSPQYDNPKTNQKMADLRSTIYWQPNIITDKDGKASFSFFNADGKGTYRVVIEGIDTDGNLGRQVYRYKVE
jgi:hypothetical protein